MRTRRRMNPENPWYGDPGGHRIAALMRWGRIKRGKVSRYRRRGRPRVSYRKAIVKRRYVRHRKRMGGRRLRLPTFSAYAIGAGKHRRRVGLASVFGEGRPGGRAFGHNPFIGRSFTMARRRRKRNTWFGQPRRHRKAALKGWRRGHKIGRRRVRHYRRNYFTNAPAQANPRHSRRRSYRKSARRRYRRNPAGINLGRLTGGLTNVQSWGPLAVTGGLSAITGAVVPQMVGVVNPWAKLGTQLVTAIAGGMLVERAVDKRHGEAWMIVGVAMVGYQLLKQFVLVPYFPQFAVGLGAYQSYYPVSSYENEYNVSQQVGAYPTEISAYPGVGAEQEEVGAYPYDGTGY